MVDRVERVTKYYSTYSMCVKNDLDGSDVCVRTYPVFEEMNEEDRINLIRNVKNILTKLEEELIREYYTNSEQGVLGL